MTDVVSSAVESGRDLRPKGFLPRSTLLGVIAAVAAVVLIAGLTYWSLTERAKTRRSLDNALNSIASLEALLSEVKDAETGQRGFLLTSNPMYKEPLQVALSQLPATIRAVSSLVADRPEQAERFTRLRTLVQERLDIINQTIVLHDAGRIAESVGMVGNDRGKRVMDGIRALVAEMVAEERQLLKDRQSAQSAATRYSFLVTMGGSVLLLFFIFSAALLAAREFRTRQSQVWLRTGQLRLSQELQGEQRLEVLGENVLRFFARFLDAQVGAIYLNEGSQHFRRIATYAVAPGLAPNELRGGEGLLGQAARDRRTVRVTDVPENYLAVQSTLGSANARELLISPAIVDGAVQAVIELGFFRKLDELDSQLLQDASEALGVAVRTSRDRSRLESLLAETQQQGEELQTQQEELRVSNEELEEQSRALLEAKQRLESQHEELEETNSQLTDQASALGQQRDELERAQSVLAVKASELERTNQYKSEFLANMSHELRTPLNSALILSKLLADNKSGNLTPEQVKFAQTISAAGNDLLTLINDVLDLSKIEAGKVELEPREVAIQPLLESVARPLAIEAGQKGVRLEVDIEASTPRDMVTDANRLTQILRNLMSNALKFTDSGEIHVRAFVASEGALSVAVSDTGIGIEAHQHEVIFEAFRQADGSTHRKHGGTGLGLSISRDLARLLGGNIVLTSEPGRGSTFTLTIPLRLSAAPLVPVKPVPRVDPPPRPPIAERSAKRAPIAPPLLADDRAILQPESRSILIVEDDSHFAVVLRDLAHEMGFKCILAQNAAEGLDAAFKYMPRAIVLDVNLPDQSGLSVLDQLKRNSTTRHIPVHVVSALDHMHQALERGAVGYALKPVKREELVTALERLESRFSQSLRRVLVVEDDERQRESIRALLHNPDVQIVAVASVAEALEHLQRATFDCMVLDLTLTDASGYELLQRMAEREELAFPPVIVYTGRSLTREEQDQLHRYSRSIILKDARSPERLLDQVTLFLHQVESRLPAEQQRLLKTVRDRDSSLDARRVLVVEDDVRNIFALSSLLEPQGIKIEIARNGIEAIDKLQRSLASDDARIDLVLMDIMMPQMDGMTAMREIRKRREFRKLPMIALTAKAMPDDQRQCMEAGANDYMAKPLDVDKLLSLVRVWMPK